MNDRSQRRSPLITLITVVVLGALGLSFGTYAYYRREARSIQAEKFRELRIISTLKISQIAAWRSERLQDARVIAAEPDLIHRVARWHTAPGGTGLREEIRRELNQTWNLHEYQDILLADPKGQLLLSLDARMTHLEPESLRGLDQAIREGQAILGEPYRCVTCGSVHLDTIAPMLGSKGIPVAILLLRSNPETQLFPLLQSWPIPSETAETLLIRRDGADVLFLNRLRHRPDEPLSLRTPMAQRELPATQAILGRAGEFFGKDYRGVDVLADLQPVPDSAWFLAAKVDSREILAETRYRSGIILALTVLGALLLAAGLMALFYSGQAKHYQDMVQVSGDERTRDQVAAESWRRGARALAVGAGLASLAVGSLVLLGWALDLPTLKGLLPGFVTMKANTAVGFQLAGTALALRASFPNHRTLTRASKLAAAALVLLAALTFLQYLTGADFRIDQILFQEPLGTVGTLAPGRMAPATAMAFILLGMGLILPHRRSMVAASQGLAFGVAWLGLLSLLGYLYGTSEMVGLCRYFLLALHTAATLLILSLGLLSCHPGEGLLLLPSASSGGWLLRRLVPFLVVAPIVLGGLEVLGESFHWYEHGMAVALLVSLTLGFLLLSTGWVARSLNRLDEVRQAAEGQARDRLEQLQAILRSLAEGVVATDTDGRVLHVNPEAERLTGWLEEDAVGQPLEAVVHLLDEGTRQSLDSLADRVRQEPEAGSLVTPTLLLTQDSTERPIAVRFAPVFDVGGALTQVVVVLRDQSADRAAQRAILASAAKYRRLHESLRDAFVQVDMSGRIVDYNRLYQEMLGYSDEELATLTYKDLTPPEWHALEARIVEEEILPKDYSPVYEKTYRRKDGTIFPVELRTFLLRGEDGIPAGMWAIVRDITERKRTEEALQASEEKFRALVDHLDVGIVVHSADTSILFANPSASSLFGLSQDQMLGKTAMDPCWALLRDDGSPLPLEAFPVLRVIASGGPLQSQVLGISRPDLPEPVWVLCNGYPVKDEQDQLLQAIITFIDITERMRAETRQARFNRILESSLNEIYVFNPRSLRFEYVNGSALRNLGYSLDDLRTMTPVDLKPEFTEATFRQAVAPLLAHELNRCDFSTVHRRADGSLYPVEVQLQLVEHVGDPVFLSIVQDATERRAAEAQIRAKTELLNLTGALGKIGGWEFDARTLQGTWTDEVARIHDLDPSQSTDVELGLRFYSEASRPLIAKAVQEAIQSGRSYDLELDLISAKGVKKTVRTIGTPVLDPGGQVVQVRGILMDITERKVAEERIRAAQVETQRLLEIADRSRFALLSLVEDLTTSENEVRRLNTDLEQRVEARTEELAAANRELEAFAYSVSHDLRAPLRHMDGFLAMLERHLGDRLDDKGAHYLEVAQQAASRMSQLVDGLLSFSRLGRTDLHRLRVDATRLAESVIEEFKTDCAGRIVHWKVGTLPMLEGDPTLLRLVFQNLVGNALKFTRGRSEARIELLPIEGLDGEVGVLILDNGVGFDPAYGHKLFGVFQRLHREEDFEGTGIGLANVHRIITRHNGRIWAEGRPGEGASFMFTLPEKKEAR